MDGGPLLLQPALKVKVWGGRRLATAGVALPDAQPYGEAWLLHDSATVARGAAGGAQPGRPARRSTALPWPGRRSTLPRAGRCWPSCWTPPRGCQCRYTRTTPGRSGWRGNRRGKTEAWYVVAAEPGARLVHGVRPGCTRAQLAAAIRNDGTLESLLLDVPVTAGDALLLRAGTVHALGPGQLVYELQQTSDRTYRLYDWGRRGLDGQPRPLHVERGLQVARLDAPAPLRHMAGRTEQVVEVARCDHFVTELWLLNDRAGRRITRDTGGRRFQALTCIAGQRHIGLRPWTTGAAGGADGAGACLRR